MIDKREYEALSLDDEWMENGGDMRMSRNEWGCLYNVNADKNEISSSWILLLNMVGS